MTKGQAEPSPHTYHVLIGGGDAAVLRAGLAGLYVFPTLDALRCLLALLGC